MVQYRTFTIGPKTEVPLVATLNVANGASPAYGGAPLDSLAYWDSLRYLAVARLLIAGILTAVVPPYVKRFEIGLLQNVALFFAAAAGYVVFALLALVVVAKIRRRFTVQLWVHVLLDLAFLAMLVFAAGGPRSGFGLLLVAPVAGAAILLSLRSALFVAAIASVILLAQSLALSAREDTSDPGFFAAAVTGVTLFSISAIVNRLARRLAIEEARAKQRGDDLRNQLLVNQLVIAELTDGVVIFSSDGKARVMNRAAHQMLGGQLSSSGSANPGMGSTLSGFRPSGPAWDVIAQQLGQWQANGQSNAFSVDVNLRRETAIDSADTSSRRVRMRFLSTQGAIAKQGRGDVVLVMEDLDRIEDQAQQLKLASMGRLSASIAHEIRNPLGAIRHANSLLAESLAKEAVPARMRLAGIVEDNTVRINRIIEDVLSIARRDRAAPEDIDLATFFESFLPEFTLQHKVKGERLSVQLESVKPMRFDENQLRQLMVNLLINALRYSSDKAASVQIEWREVGADNLELSIRDDGPGLPESLLPHLFEPFMTTESRGTGLGLYLARELCHANAATIRYQRAAANHQFGGFIVAPAVR